MIKEQLEKALETVKSQLENVQKAYKEVTDNLKMLNQRKIQLKSQFDELNGAAKAYVGQLREFFPEQAQPEVEVIS